MQRGRGIHSFPETIDLNQGSVTNNAPMDHPDPWDINVRNPVENRLSNYMLPPGDGNVSCTHIDDGYNRSLGDRDHGESSSGGARLAGSSFEPSDSSSYAGRHSYSLNHGSVDANLNHGQLRDHDGHRGVTDSRCKSGYSEMDQGRAFYSSLDNVGTSLGYSRAFPELNDSLGPLSCKRKAFEGTSEQFCADGSSSSTRPMGNSVLQHPSTYPGPVDLSISSGMGTSSSVHGTGESSTRNFSIRLNHGQHEPVSVDAPRGTSVRHVGTSSAQSSRRIANADSSSDLRSLTRMPASLNANQPHLTRVNEHRGMHLYPWDGYFGGSSSGSFANSGDRGSEARDEAIARSSSRNNLGHPMTVSALETRNILQDQIDWSFTPGAPASSRNQSASSRRGLSPGGPGSSSAWLPHENQELQNHQIHETAPWIPFAPGEPEYVNRRRHLTLSPSTSSPDEGASTSRAQHQLRRSSTPFLMDIPGDDINGFRALAAVEGRHRMMRQVLNAMRRGVHLQTEDYMLIDPFINEIAELHDRHRDMRLDVDNMSYEELLALEEQIGNVSTGLSEEKILGLMKRHKHTTMVEALPNMEPCCICQENYLAADDIGILDCGHDFHTVCIKQWLAIKNLCPICKTVALNT